MSSNNNPCNNKNNKRNNKCYLSKKITKKKALFGKWKKRKK